MKLEQTDITAFETSLKEHLANEDKILSRIKEVLNLICDEGCYILNDWWFGGVQGASLTAVWTDGDCVHIAARLYVDYKHGNEKPVVRDLISNFRKSFLTMENEEIREIVREEIQSAFDSEQKEREAKKLQYEKISNKRKAALSKLTDEDRAALGIYD